MKYSDDKMKKIKINNKEIEINLKIDEKTIKSFYDTYGISTTKFIYDLVKDPKPPYEDFIISRGEIDIILNDIVEENHEFFKNIHERCKFIKIKFLKCIDKYNNTNNLKKILEEKYIKEYEIENYIQLIELITGKSEIPDLRRNYIFRGLKKKEYPLKPSSLRKENNKSILNLYTDDKLHLITFKKPKEWFEEGSIDEETFNDYKEEESIGYVTNKFGKIIKNEPKAYTRNEDDVHERQELHLLIDFLSLVDKSGLKISVNSNIRKLIHGRIDEDLDSWPSYDLSEVMSLAQHYGLPTRAQDWSYDFKVATYFCVINALDENCDGVIWALNYKKYEDNYISEKLIKRADGRKILKLYPLQFYRPEYNLNPNLRAQKGLFSIIHDVPIERTNPQQFKIDKRPLDQFIIEELEKYSIPSENKNMIELPDLKKFEIEDDEKILYKFIIPREIKSEILKELYLEGYSEDNLFPGYEGVIKFMKNKSRLSTILELESCFKSNYEINSNLQNLISSIILSGLEYLIIMLPQLINKYYKESILKIELKEETYDENIIQITIVTNSEYDLDKYNLIKSFLYKHYEFELSKNILIDLNFKNKNVKRILME